MNTSRLIPVSLVALGFLLVSCSAATNPVPTQTPLAPAQKPSETIPPVSTPNPADTLPPAPSITPAPGSAGTVDITVQNFAFNPPTITIKVGTTVRWTNQDSASHSITSDTGVWDSGGIAQGKSYTRVFDTVGTFAYHCGIHPSMKGTIIVTS